MKPHAKWLVCFNLFVILAFVLSACSPAAYAGAHPTRCPSPHQRSGNRQADLLEQLGGHQRHGDG